MARTYKVVCANQEPVWHPTTQHAHIVSIGTGVTRAVPTRRWGLREVLAALDRGDAFYTVSPSTGKTALVRAVSCPSCGHLVIRSGADAVTDNNLDSLPRCS